MKKVNISPDQIELENEYYEYCDELAKKLYTNLCENVKSQEMHYEVIKTFLSLCIENEKNKQAFIDILSNDALHLCYASNFMKELLKLQENNEPES